MMMRMLVAATLLATGETAARAQEKVAQETLPFLANLGPHAKLASNGALEIHATGEGPHTIPILETHSPKLASHSYSLKGRVKYDDIEGTAYVEMWSFFPGGAQFFTRTMEDMGPMARLNGSSDWRDISLPFDGKPGLLPNKLTVNVFLPGKGTVQLTPLTLSPMSPGWWSESCAGWVGGIAGGTLGIFGGVIGMLAGMGKARRFTLGLCLGCIIVGGILLSAGVVALVMKQPYHVYYPLLLIGGIAALVCGLNYPAIRRRYQNDEIRRMSAMDG